MKVFTLFLSLVIVSLSVIACVEIPLGPSDNSTESDHDADLSGMSEVSDPSDASYDVSVDISFAEESEDISTDSSLEEPSEPVSSSVPPYVVPEDYPYQNIALLDSYEIGEDQLDEYFRNSAFIGNSIMVHFNNYVSNKRAKYSDFLGKCKFLAASAYSPLLEFEKDPRTNYFIKYQGEYMHVWDAVNAAGVDTVYVSLMALNELGLHSTATCAEGTFNNFVKMLDKIKEVNPDITIVVLSNTYMVNTVNYKNLNNTNIYKLNCLTLDYCNENGIAFLDVSSPITADGYLIYDYCLDPDPSKNGNACHLKEKCYKAWVAVLRNYSYAMQNGGYKNPEVMPEP